MALTETGLEIPTVEGLLTDMSSSLRGDIDPTLDTTADSPQGQLLGIFASHLREAWEALAVAFNINPADAEDFLLEWICSLTGTFRRPATKSRFVGLRKITLTLDAGTTVPAGSVVHVEGKPDVRFVTTADAVNGGAVAADVLAEAEAEDAGPVVANAGTLTVIATPVVGWTAVTNTLDAELGKLRESDAELRIRREVELRKPGTGTVDAIAVDLESISYEGEEPVLDAHVFENTTMAVDARGLPPKSIEALVLDGLDQALPDNVIAQAVWNSKAGGIKAYGTTTTGIALDRTGKPHVVPFTRPEIVPIFIQVEIGFDGLTYAGDETLASAIALGMQSKARSEMLIAWSDVVRYAQTVPGVVRVTQVSVVDADSAVFLFTDFQMGLREFPLFDSGNVLIAGTPE